MAATTCPGIPTHNPHCLSRWPFHWVQPTPTLPNSCGTTWPQFCAASGVGVGSEIPQKCSEASSFKRLREQEGRGSESVRRWCWVCVKTYQAAALWEATSSNIFLSRSHQHPRCHHHCPVLPSVLGIIHTIEMSYFHGQKALRSAADQILRLEGQPHHMLIWWMGERLLGGGKGSQNLRFLAKLT